MIELKIVQKILNEVLDNHNWFFAYFGKGQKKVIELLILNLNPENATQPFYWSHIITGVYYQNNYLPIVSPNKRRESSW